MTTVYTALTSTTQATQALALNTAIGNMVTSITTHPGWTLFDSRTSLGSGTWNYWVLKNASAYSGLSIDYYVIITQSGTTANAILAESYVGTTAVSAVQTITVTGSPTGGTFTLAARDRAASTATTGTIAFNASAATVQTTLQAATTIGAGNATVTGSNGGPWTVTYASALANSYIPTMTLTTNSLTGGSSPTVTVTDATVGVFACEAYYMTAGAGGLSSALLDSSARFQFPGTSTTTGAAFGAHPVTGAPTLWLPQGVTTTHMNGYAQFSTSAQSLAATTVFYTVTTYDDHLVFAFGTAANTVRYWYYGAATSLYANSGTTDPVVLLTQDFSPLSSQSNIASGGFTRMPASYVSTTQGNWVLSTLQSGAGCLGRTQQLENPLAGPSGDLGQTAPYLDPSQGTYQLSRFHLPLMDPAISGSFLNQATSMRCVMNNLLVSYNAPSAIVLGDTIAFNGTYWQYCGGISGTTQTTPFAYTDTGVAV